MYCQKCGEYNKDGAAFCNKCGSRLNLANESTTTSDINAKFNSAILTQIETLEGQKKGHIGPLILVIIGIILFFVGRFPGIVAIYSDYPLSTIGSIMMSIAVFWDLWRIKKSENLEKQIETLRANLE